MAIPPLGCPRSTRLAVRAEAAEDFGEAWRQALENILSTLADVIPRADIVPAHNSITPGACSRGALRTDLLHDWTPIPFVVSDALRGRTTAAGYNAPMTHFRNRRCLASCRRRLGRASRAQARGGSLLLTFPIGGRGFRHRRPLPDRPPTFQAFRSVLSETTSVSTRRLIKGSRSYLRRHGVQSRGAAISYHKLALSVYRKFCRAKQVAIPPVGWNSCLAA